MPLSSDEHSPDARSLRFVSWNVHACIGMDGLFDPARIRGVLEDLRADFIGIQELEDRDFDDSSVSEYLARALGMHAYRGSTLKRGDAHYGNLLLSRDCAIKTRMHDISVPGREPRGVIEAEYDIRDRNIRVLVTHLGLRGRERRRQVDAIANYSGRNGAHLVVLMGDFNEWWPASYTVRSLQQQFGSVLRHRSWPARRPILALDGICISPSTIECSDDVCRTTAARQASDHLPVICDVRLKIP